MPDQYWRAELERRLTRLALPPAREAEIVEELAAHLDDRYRDHVNAGMTDADARRLALADLDDADVLASRLRRVETHAPSDATVPGRPPRANVATEFWQDLRYGWRSLRKTPALTAAALIMLALGTGANAAVFSVVDRVLLRARFADDARIVMLTDRRYTKGVAALLAPPDEVRSLESMTGVFASVSAFGLASPTLSGAGDPRNLRVECVSASMFRVLGVQPVVGRAFGDEDDRPGADPVIVTSDALARETFGDAQAALGRTLSLDGHPVTVIGVTSADFDGVRGFHRIDGWAPIGQGEGRTSAVGCTESAFGSNVYARIRSDLTRATADARLQALTDRTRGLMSFDESTIGDDRDTFLVVVGAVGLVLLIVCANVANLLLTRSLGRRSEMATRLALGASPARLVRQILTESLMLSTLGAVAGLVVARLALATVVSLLPVSAPQASRVAIDLRVLAVMLSAGVLAGLLAGLPPAWRTTSRGLTTWLQDTRTARPSDRAWTTRVLVVAEIALSVALVVGAALVMRTFLMLRPTHPGFDPTSKIVAQTRLSSPRYATAAARRAFIDDVMNRVAHVPGVRGVSATNFPPFGGLVAMVPIAVPGRPDVTDARLTAFTSTVTSNYFEEMRMSVLGGRAFVPADDGRSLPVAIVGDALARRLWPDGQAIGRSIVVNSAAFAESGATPREVVGVVNDARLFGNTTQPSLELYLPLAQETTLFVSVVVRTSDAGGNDLNANIRHEVAAVDPMQVVDSIVSFDDMLSQSTTGRRSLTWLMGAFAAMAVGLAIAGLMAVIAASVAQRTREIGIRAALGARPAAVVRLVLWQAVPLTLTGVTIGLGLAAATTRFLAKSLYGVTPLDGPTFVVSALVMFAATMAASYLPARHATRVDPLAALKME